MATCRPEASRMPMLPIAKACLGPCWPHFTIHGVGRPGIILFSRINELVFKRTILSVLLFSGLCLVV
jgi:hypothetical protein